MLTAVRQRDGLKFNAWEADKGDRPFLCQCCQRPVTLRKGDVKAPHFAHLPPVTCEYGTGESDEHRRCKISIYESLVTLPVVRKCEMERNLGTVRPDVSAYIKGVPVAIEVQLSTLSLSKIMYRTAEYGRKGIYVLWLPLHTSLLNQDLYAPRTWEQWLHAAYFGRVYYWCEGLLVKAVHFRTYYAYVRGRTKDYQKFSRKKVPLEGPTLTLTEDFAPRIRDAWSSDNFSVPPARLFTDSRPRWY